MPAREEIGQAAYDLGLPIAHEMGVALWEVEYRLEAGMNILRFVLDGAGDTVVDLDLCEAYSRAVEAELDRVDPIEESYYLEVSSAGIGRALTRPFHFAAYLNHRVEVWLRKTLGDADVPNAARLQFDSCDRPIPVDITRFEATLNTHEQRPEGDAVVLADDAGLAFTLPLADVDQIRLAVAWPDKKKKPGKRSK